MQGFVRRYTYGSNNLRQLWNVGTRNSMNPAAVIYEELTVILPHEIYAGENHAGEILVDFDGSGCLYPLSRLLCDHNHNGPALVVPSTGKRTKYVDLEVVV